MVMNPMTEPSNNFEKAFLEEDASMVAFSQKSLQEAFLEWAHENGYELFVVPVVVDENGKLTLDDPDDDLVCYALSPKSSRL